MPNDPYALAALRESLPGVDLDATNGSAFRVVRANPPGGDPWEFTGVKVPTEGRRGEPVAIAFRPDAAADARAGSVRARAPWSR